MNTMTLQQIRYVFEISRYGSISKAAQELYLTQPYLSNILKDLENELHITIFNRNRKGVTLTEEGMNFMQYAKPLLDQEKRILELYNQKHRELPFTFTISLQHYPFAVEAFFQFLRERNPRTFEVHIRECGMEQVIYDVFGQRSELGIIFISETTEPFILKYLSSRNLEFNEITTVYPRVFFHRNHPMASRSEIALEDMQDYPFASFESTSSVSLDFSEEAMIPDIVKIKRHFYVMDRATMINTLSHTDAFSIGSGILSDGFAGAELVSRPIAGTPSPMRIGWIHIMNAQISDNGLAFLNSMKHILQKRPNA